MKVLVTYASHFGATKGIAERIRQTFEAQGISAQLHSVEDRHLPPAEGFDAYVIGSAVHAGHWLKPAVEYVRQNAGTLAAQPVWLFSSGPIGEPHVHQPQPDPKEVPELMRLIAARDHVVFAGAFSRLAAEASDTNWLERAFVRFIPEGDFRDWPAIERWTKQIASELLRVPVPA